MDFRKLLLVLMVVLAGLLAGCASHPALQLGEADAGKTVELRSGESLVVSLQGNITTGFTWVPAAQDPAQLKQVGDAVVTPESDAIGAGGVIVLRFEAVATGQTVLRLEYKRPWETDVAPLQTYEVTVVVK